MRNFYISHEMDQRARSEAANDQHETLVHLSLAEEYKRLAEDPRFSRRKVHRKITE